MRKLRCKDCAGSHPGTNVLWMQYLAELLLSSIVNNPLLLILSMLQAHAQADAQGLGRQPPWHQCAVDAVPRRAAAQHHH
jgi:hypothetical protein